MSGLEGWDDRSGMCVGGGSVNVLREKDSGVGVDGMRMTFCICMGKRGRERRRRRRRKEGRIEV